MQKEILKKLAGELSTPSFVFDADEFAAKAMSIKKALGDIPLCFSIKANPFLLSVLPDCISKVEVCSPGELTICKNLSIAPEKIIYSGVNKGEADITEALEYGVAIITAESPLHVQLINEISIKLGIKAHTILRLSNGNQFGMDGAIIEDIIANRADYDGLDIIGYHYYTGTAKKKKNVIDSDVDDFENFIDAVKEKYGYSPSHVEYGPGMSAEYFNPPYEEKDDEILATTCERLKDFGKKYNLTVEMGRFLASSCGTYLTAVADLKTTGTTNYVICDGGMNHLKYYGQTMAMQIPPISVLNDSEECKAYTLCGSLCTTADILVRKVELPELKIGDVLAFGRCGAYTVTEGIGLFLSRTLPKIAVYSKKNGVTVVRDFYNSDILNTPRGFEK